LFGGAGADILEGSGGADTIAYLATSEFGDLIEGYVSGTDDFMIQKSGAGFEALASLSALTASNFTVSEVDGSGNYVSIGSDPVFVLDDNPSTAASLWYDGDGDGLGAIKVADFNSTSVLAGFDHDDFFLV
jgi:Ca2+-binding RTX toxin-like protein